MLLYHSDILVKINLECLNILVYRSCLYIVCTAKFSINCYFYNQLFCLYFLRPGLLSIFTSYVDLSVITIASSNYDDYTGKTRKPILMRKKIFIFHQHI